MGRYIKDAIKLTVKGQQSGGTNVPSGSSSQRPTDSVAGTTRFNTDSNNLEVHNGTNYETIAKEGNVSIVKDSFTGDDITTAYTLTVTPPNENSILVFVGNVFQNPGTAFSLSGNILTFTSPPPSSHVIIVLHGFSSTVVS